VLSAQDQILRLLVPRRNQNLSVGFQFHSPIPTTVDAGRGRGICVRHVAGYHRRPEDWRGELPDFEVVHDRSHGLVAIADKFFAHQCLP
jgi:hypothetical protein